MVLAHDVKEGQRTNDIQISVDVTFDSLLLSHATLCGLKGSGFNKPSPIQLHGIPLGKCGFDLLLEAKSGTGKTVVFTVIALESIDLGKGLQVVILAPTREIAFQVSDVIKQIGSNYEGLNVEVVMGGLPVEEDIHKLKKNVHILVGSPGRMRHLIQDKHVQVSAVRLFVLDEADKLMDKSFQADINYIFSALPKEKQVVMSSATYPNTLQDIMKNYVQKAQRICPDSNSILLGIKQLVTVVTSNINVVRQTHYKFQELLKILTKQEFKQCLIFCNYQGRVIELSKMLLREKWPAEQLHGLLDQNDRLDALKTLQDYKCRILVSTDIAARGIDASNVDLVINFEPPVTWPTYLHRIGRTGRFGSYGIAITILSKGEVNNFKEMIKNINVPININCLWNDNAFELFDLDTKNANSEKATEILETSQLAKTYKTPQIDETCVMPEITEKDQDKDSCEELLDLSTFNKEKNITNLFDSFQICKGSKIETFDDLMTSFKDHDPNNNKKHIKTDRKEDTKSKQDNSSVDSVTSQNNEEQLTSNKSPEKHVKQNGYIQKNDDSFQIIEDYADLDTNLSQKLKDAGLPTAFGSTKHANRNLMNESKHSYFSKNIGDKEKVNNSQYMPVRSKYKKTISKIFEAHLGKSNEEIIHEGIDNLQSSLPSRSYNCELVQNKDSHKMYSKREEFLNSSSEISYNSDAINYHKYMTWYKNLKAHIKQVEMALYIDELSYAQN